MNHTLPAVLLSLALAACAGGADLPEAAVEAPAAWGRQGQQPGFSPAADLGADQEKRASDPAWWGNFGAPDLARLMVRAHSANPDLSAARHRIEAARAQVKASRSALLPAVSLGFDAGRSDTVSGEPAGLFGAGLGARWEIDLWGGARATVAASQAKVDAQAAAAEGLKLSLEAEMASLYFQWIGLGARVASAREILETSEKTLQLVERREELGEASRLDIARQRSAVAGLRAGIPELEALRERTRNAILALVGETPSGARLTEMPIDAVIVPEVNPGVPSDVLMRRPDLRRAAALIAAARGNVDAARSAMLPSLSLTAAGGLASGALSALFDPAGTLFSVAASTTAKIFDGGRLAAGVEVAQAEAKSLAEEYRSAAYAAFRDVEDALATLDHLKMAEESRRLAASEAGAAHAMALARYEAGEADLMTLLDAQRTRLEQDDAVRRIRSERLIAAVSLYKALGGSW